MAFLRRNLCREVTDANRCTLVFDTDSKRLYVEREVPHLDATVSGTVDWQMAKMDIADYLKQGRQTAGHHELWQLLETLFAENDDRTEYTDDTSSAAITYSKFRIWGNCYGNGPMF
jgi:hypothetical protein